MKTCKKCGRTLPVGYKARLCENCLGKKANTLANAGKGVLGLAVLAVGTVATIVTKGKINPTKK